MANEHPGVENDRGKCRVRYNDSEKKRKSKTLEIPYTPAGRAKAFKIRQQLIKAALAPAPVEADLGPAPEPPTFFEAAHGMLEVLQVKPSSMKTMLVHLNKWWMPVFHDQLVTEITRAKIKRGMAPLMREMSAKYARDVLSSGSNVFQHAIEEEWIDHNPVLPVSQSIKVPKKLVDPFEFAERDAILKKADWIRSAVLHDPVLLWAPTR